MIFLLFKNYFKFNYLIIIFYFYNFRAIIKESKSFLRNGKYYSRNNFIKTFKLHLIRSK